MLLNQQQFRGSARSCSAWPRVCLWLRCS